METEPPNLLGERQRLRPALKLKARETEYPSRNKDCHKAILWGACNRCKKERKNLALRRQARDIRIISSQEKTCEQVTARTTSRMALDRRATGFAYLPPAPKNATNVPPQIRQENPGSYDRSRSQFPPGSDGQVARARNGQTIGPSARCKQPAWDAGYHPAAALALPPSHSLARQEGVERVRRVEWPVSASESRGKSAK